MEQHICILSTGNIDDGSNNNTNKVVTNRPNTNKDNQLAVLSTAKPMKPDTIENLNEIPIIVWISFTIPFISIIVLGIICGRRLRQQGENIRSASATIQGVHMDNVYMQQQQEVLGQYAQLNLPPPTYEKVTGIVPPGYETVLQDLHEKRMSIFDSMVHPKELLAAQQQLATIYTISGGGGGADSSATSAQSSPSYTLAHVPRYFP